MRRPEADKGANRRAAADAAAPGRGRPQGGSPLSRRKRFANALLALGLAAPLAAAAAISPGAVESGPILCWLRAATGLRCPFCGMTRSFVYLAHGALGASAGAHPAGPILFFALALAALVALAAAIRGDAPIGARRDFLRFAQAVGVLCIAVGLVAHVLENQDGALLDLLHAG